MRTSRYEPYFRDKKITVMGIGLLGRGIGDIDFLASAGAEIIATDLRSKQTLKDSHTALKHHKNISFVFDRHRVRDFRKRDLILHAAGVQPDNKYLEAAAQANIPTIMSFGLVLDILKREGVKVTVIGITGTKGKSTTTAMVEKILSEAKLRYHLGGNIRGVANLPLLKKVVDGDIILAELDSWQLQALHKCKQSPDIAIFTNFFEDHMNYYKGSMKRYFEDKSAIFKYQERGDTLIMTTNASQAVNQYHKEPLKGKKVIARFSKLPKSWKYRVFGSHNEQNLALAYEVGKVLDLPQKVIKEAITCFPGVDGRFQYLGTSTKREFMFFNDNNSTTPRSTIESLNSLKKRFPNKNIILIGGGADKNFDYEKLSGYIARNVRYAFLFPGAATEKICEAFPPAFKKFTKTLSMKTAFNLALREAEHGDIIILSPAAASFGLFSNEYDRNDQYVKQVKSYLRRDV